MLRCTCKCNPSTALINYVTWVLTADSIPIECILLTFHAKCKSISIMLESLRKSQGIQ